MWKKNCEYVDKTTKNCTEIVFCQLFFSFYCPNQPSNQPKRRRKPNHNNAEQLLYLIDVFLQQNLTLIELLF